MAEGWIKLHRSILDYAEDTHEPFCKRMAWVHLLLLANHKPGIIRKRGLKIELNRGDVGVSLRTLAVSWRWSVGKVVRFLDQLENDGKVEQKKSRVMYCISLINYNEEQGDGTQTEQQRNTDGTPTERKRIQNKNDKNDKNVNNLFPADEPPEFKKLTELQFFAKVDGFKNLYSAEVLRAFFNYWSEKDAKGKMKFQLQKTWELNKRLITWSNNNQNFKHSNNGNSRQPAEVGRAIEFDKA